MEEDEMIFEIKPDTKFVSGDYLWDKYDEFVDLVKKECKSIKQHFTQEQIDKLYDTKIYGDDPYRCIYGIMTGNCNSNQAAEFIVNNLDVLVEHEANTNEIYAFPSGERTYSVFQTPMEQYITPFEDEYSDVDVSDYKDSYWDRINEVLNWIKE
jgi:hypothetical protein